MKYSNYISTIVTEPLPANWKAGFNSGDIVPANGGKEVPVYSKLTGWTLLCWDYREQRHLTYFYRSDTFDA